MDYYTTARAFVRAAVSGSFSKAAEELGIKTSTVSRYIGELEKSLGIALFNRSTRGLVMTEGGRTFLASIEPALDAMDEASRATSALNQSPQGLLRVTLPVALAHRHVLPHMPAFMQLYPDIRVDAVVTDDTVNMIGAGIDVALRIGVVSDSSLMGRRLGPYRLAAWAHASYLERHGNPSEPAALAEHHCLTAASPNHAWHFHHRQKAGAAISVTLGGSFCSNDLQALLTMAQAGAGIALLPAWMVDGAAQPLRRVLPDWSISRDREAMSVWALYPPKKTVSSKVRAFVDFYATRLEKILDDTGDTMEGKPQ